MVRPRESRRHACVLHHRQHRQAGQNALRLATRLVQHAYLDGFAERILFAGPAVTEDGSQSMGNLIVFEADSYADAEAFARADPYAKADLFDTTCIRPWKCTFGRLMEQA